jgi:hypothetical protein
VQNKINPHFSQKATNWTAEQLKRIVELKCSTAREYIDRAFTCMTAFSSMRGEDTNHCICRNTKILPADESKPRRFRWIFDRTKNDPQGKGPVSGRTFYVACICMESQGKGEKQAFARGLLVDAF